VSTTNKGRDIERRIPWPDYLSSFFGAAAAGQRLDAIYLFAGLFINGCVAEVDVAVQGRVRVVLVVIYLISGSSVALLVPKTRGEVRNTAAVAHGGCLYVVYVWGTSSPFSVGTRHLPFSIQKCSKHTRNAQRYSRMADALPLFTRLEFPSRKRATALYVVEAQTLVWHQMGA
jgi:hypothetical protein